MSAIHETLTFQQRENYVHGPAKPLPAQARLRNGFVGSVRGVGRERIHHRRRWPFRSGLSQEHIPGALNLPHRAICSNSTASLDKSKLYVCYCDGIGCNASTKTALKLLTLGFQVRELIGGLDWWKRDGYATAGDEAQPGTEAQCGC